MFDATQLYYATTLFCLWFGLTSTFYLLEGKILKQNNKKDDHLYEM